MQVQYIVDAIEIDQKLLPCICLHIADVQTLKLNSVV
jgi:hypothetical protein